MNFVKLVLFSADNCVWNVVGTNTEKLLEVPLHALEPIPIRLVGTASPSEHVEVIPMQEELEVRLEEGTFPVPADWNYNVRMDSEMVAAALGNAQNQNPAALNMKQPQPYQEFSGNQVKLELEVTLTPEIVSSDSLITSTVSGSTINGSNLTVTSAVNKAVATVIPPTTIVCLPSVVSTAPMINQPVNQQVCNFF